MMNYIFLMVFSSRQCTIIFSKAAYAVIFENSFEMLDEYNWNSSNILIFYVVDNCKL